MASVGILGVKLPGEKIFIDADFVNLFATGITILSATVTATRSSGAADASPSSIIQGPCNISGTIVSQFIKDGVPGTSYLLTFSATGSDATVLDIQLVLPVASIRLG